jgi:hypothetical protein
MFKTFRSSLMGSVFYSPPNICFDDPDPPGGDPPGGGGGGKTFSLEYVQELRAEAKGLRLQLANAIRAKEDAETKATAAAKEAADKVTAAEKAATDAIAIAKTEAEKASTDAIAAAKKETDDRVIRTELRVEATKAGMHDLDGLKLVDASALKIKDDGTVEGVADLMTKLKTDKPYLFGTSRGTTNTDIKPPPKPGQPKNAKDLTDAEYAAALKTIDGGHLPA